ncbi:MAG: hypothetical protein ACR2QE_12295 [Acidimicrobiales bacterium]
MLKRSNKRNTTKKEGAPAGEPAPAPGGNQKRLLIHVGTGKTGTTAIQEALARNEDRLKEAGYHIIESNRAREGSCKHGVSWRDHDDSSWKALAAEAESLRDSDADVIISSEGLWNQQADVFESIRDLFPDFAPQAYLYVREQAEYIQALGLQFSKGRHGDSTLDFLDPDDLAEYMNRRPAMDYYDTCVRLEAGLGEGVVTARLFSTDRLYENDIVADFFHRIGFDGPVERPSGIVNAGISVELARTLARYDTEPPEDLRRMELRDLAAKMTVNGIGTKYFLPREYVEQLRAIYRDSNIKFATEYLQNGDALPEAEVWRPEGEDQTEEIEALLLKTACDFPMLREGGWGNRRTGMRMLGEGFKIKERPRPLTGTIEGDEAIMRFRTSNAVRTWLHDQLRLQISTLDDEPLRTEVSVNGTDLGEFLLPAQEVVVPLELIEPYDQVAMTLRPTTPDERAPIIGLTFPDLVG